MSSRRVPVLIYDRDCGFCRSWIARWRRGTGERVRYLPFQSPWVRWRYRVRKRDARVASQLIDTDGRHYAGAPAMLRALLRASSPWLRLAARVALLPGTRLIAGAAYRVIARHRRAASRAQRIVEAILGPREPKRPFWVALSRPGLARRGLGAIYLAAFTSLRAQVLGLYGARGILPIGERLARERGPRSKGSRRLSRLRTLPTLLWLDSSDAGLLRLCRAGQIAGAALALDVAPRASAAVGWGCYLSFASVGRVFLRFQWDSLLLEAGLHAMLGRRRRSLMRLLALRLQLESGLAKLASHDPSWRNLGACCYHQETQPLPTPLGWYAHHLPRRIRQGATALTLAVECAVPFLALGPRRLRQPAFLILTGFQGLIAATGNYAFFNWLTAVLNLALVERPAPRASETLPRRAADAFAVVEDLLAGGVLLLGLADLVERLRPDLRPPAPIERVTGALAPFHVVGSYGLFSVMTTARPEIVIEGSDDGESWREYGFRYKPGDVTRPPAWVAPHQPRLDWQMWFAALQYAPPPWFESFLTRVLEGSPDVLALLGTNPFPDKPPRYLRALSYQYRIADWATHRRTGAWWVRTPLGLYFPPCTLRR